MTQNFEQTRENAKVWLIKLREELGMLDSTLLDEYTEKKFFQYR